MNGSNEMQGGQAGARLIAVLVLCLCLLSITGCGKKTAPVFPEQSAPGPVADLAVKGEKEGIVFEWRAPEIREGGEGQGEAVAYSLYRRPLQRDGETPFTLIASIPSASTVIDKVTYRDATLEMGRMYEYRIVAVDSERVESPESRTVRARFNGESSVVQVLQRKRRGSTL
jgi:predicted small lipoprotein YifL